MWQRTHKKRRKTVYRNARDKNGNYVNPRFVPKKERIPYEYVESIYGQLEQCLDVLFGTVMKQSAFTDDIITKMNEKVMNEVTNPNINRDAVASLIVDAQSRQIENLTKVEGLINEKEVGLKE